MCLGGNIFIHCTGLSSGLSTKNSSFSSGKYWWFICWFFSPLFLCSLSEIPFIWTLGLLNVTPYFFFPIVSSERSRRKQKRVIILSIKTFSYSSFLVQCQPHSLVLDCREWTFNLLLGQKCKTVFSFQPHLNLISKFHQYLGLWGALQCKLECFPAFPSSSSEFSFLLGEKAFKSVESFNVHQIC